MLYSLNSSAEIDKSWASKIIIEVPQTKNFKQNIKFLSPNDKNILKKLIEITSMTEEEKDEKLKLYNLK